MDHDETSASPLQAKFVKLLQRRRQESKLRTLKASKPGSVDLSSNDFLSLSSSPDLRKRFLQELEHPSFPLGSTGSRLLDGNSAYAEALEQDIANFHGASAGLLANSGFDANVGIFSCIPQPGDIIVYDELIHASVHDGMKMSRAGLTMQFAHNDVADLRVQLEALKLNNSLLSAGQANVFIAVESVYSMEGDLAPLTEIADLAEELFPFKNAHVIVDEAHATGVYGCQGRGRVSELGLESRMFIRLHTFGKALACNGAIIICSPLTRLYLINYARSLIYTTFMSYPALAAIRAAYTVMAQGGTETLSTQLFALMDHLHDSLQTLQSQHGGREGLIDLVEFPTQCPKSPIFSLVTAHPRSLAQCCQESGFVVRAVVPPTVPQGTERVRVCLHSGNTEEQIEGFVRTVGRWIEARREQEQSSHSAGFTATKARL